MGSSDRPKCWYCELEALDGHLTCGNAGCSETLARAEAHSQRKGGLAPRGGRPRERAPTEALARSSCGVTNGYLKISCARPPEHGGPHASGRLKWVGGERPRYQEPAEAFSDAAPASDGDRLQELTQVLLTARAQMLGLGTGLRKALDEMPRAVDTRAVRGLVGALGHIVQHLDHYAVQQGETVMREGLRLGADAITAAEFDVSAGSPPPPSPFPSSLAEAAVDAVRRVMSEKVARLEARVRELEKAPPVPEACRGLVLAYRADRSRAGRELSRVEKALLVAAVRGVWGGPGFGGDWVDRMVESSTVAEGEGAIEALRQLGYLTERGPTFDGVRLAVVLMDST